MDNPSPFQLQFNGTALQVSAAGTFVSDWVDCLEGMDSVSLQANFKYGGGGQGVQVYFQTSLDQGQTPIDIWAPNFTTASGVGAATIAAAASQAAIEPTDGALAAGDIVNGLLGDRIRAKVVVTGAYTGSTLLNLTGIPR